ncbi:MAG: winged helix-turn-helix transcriptional regulator [Sphingomonas sp.]
MELTDAAPPAPLSDKRRYDDACTTAHAMELLGDRWAMLVVRELLFGGRRFNELRHGLPGISANVLTQRLEALEASRVVQRRKLPLAGGAHQYELTAWGQEAESVILALGRWGAQSIAHDPALPLSAASLMLRLRAALLPERLGQSAACIGFDIDGELFTARLGSGAMAVKRGCADNPDLLLCASAATLAGLFRGERPLGEYVATGALAIEGSRALAHWLTTLFAATPKPGSA